MARHFQASVDTKLTSNWNFEFGWVSIHDEGFELVNQEGETLMVDFPCGSGPVESDHPSIVPGH